MEKAKAAATTAAFIRWDEVPKWNAFTFDFKFANTDATELLKVRPIQIGHIRDLFQQGSFRYGTLGVMRDWIEYRYGLYNEMYPMVRMLRDDYESTFFCHPDVARLALHDYKEAQGTSTILSKFTMLPLLPSGKPQPPLPERALPNSKVEYVRRILRDNPELFREYRVYAAPGEVNGLEYAAGDEKVLLAEIINGEIDLSESNLLGVLAETNLININGSQFTIPSNLV